MIYYTLPVNLHFLETIGNSSTIEIYKTKTHQITIKPHQITIRSLQNPPRITINFHRITRKITKAGEILVNPVVYQYVFEEAPAPYLGGFHGRGGTPKWWVYFMENPTQMADAWGYP